MTKFPTERAEAAGADGPALSAGEFREISRMAYEYAGLDLGENKTQLVLARLGKKLREMQIPTFSEYCRRVREDRTGESMVAMIDALTTNHTSFLREGAHFDFLSRVVLPELAGRTQVAIWSAACSTGEEPYSIVFTALEAMGLDGMRKLRVLATDISTKALGKAAQAVYPMERMKGMRQDWMSRYLMRGTGRWEGHCQVKKKVRDLVEFRRQNLMESFSHLGPFQVIFCRNVMIYFDRETQQDLVRRLAGRLEPGGYLFTGHAESLNGLDQPLQYVQPATYRKAGEGGAERRRKTV
ncbi:MAG: protein-glutamate O-methyltransferase CheR [Bryobacterales bacterium]|nr:protein-glutamate O-methyltransferase CheR [Bryobacterales bacterium]